MIERLEFLKLASDFSFCPDIKLSSNLYGQVVTAAAVHFIQFRHMCYHFPQGMNGNARNFWNKKQNKTLTQGWRRYRPVLGLGDAKVRREVIPSAWLLLGKDAPEPYGWCRG